MRFIHWFFLPPSWLPGKSLWATLPGLERKPEGKLSAKITCDFDCHLLRPRKRVDFYCLSCWYSIRSLLLYMHRLWGVYNDSVLSFTPRPGRCSYCTRVWTAFSHTWGLPADSSVLILSIYTSFYPWSPVHIIIANLTTSLLSYEKQ